MVFTLVGIHRVVMWPRGSLDWLVGSYVLSFLGILWPIILGSIPESGIDSRLFDHRIAEFQAGDYGSYDFGK